MRGWVGLSCRWWRRWWVCRFPVVRGSQPEPLPGQPVQFDSPSSPFIVIFKEVYKGACIARCGSFIAPPEYSHSCIGWYLSRFKAYYV